MGKHPDSLFTPLHWAGYLTWATLLVAALLVEAGGTDSSTARVAAICVLMGVFLVGFVYRSRVPFRRPGALSQTVAALAQIGATLALIAISGQNFMAVLLVIVMAQSTTLPKAWLVGIGVIGNLGFLGLLLHQHSTFSAWIIWMLFAGFQAFAALTEHYARQAESSRDELARANAHLLATQSLLEESARDSERLRLARDLHDVFGHKLTALKLQLALQQRKSVSPEGLAVARQLTSELLDDLRGVVRQVHRRDGLGLRRAIEELAAPLPYPAIHLDIADDALAANADQAEALLRTAQEALTNAAKHSGARQVHLQLIRDGGRILLSIDDDGRGCDPVHVGKGLAGMRERLELLGGGVDFDGSGGFRVEAWVPAS